MSGWGEGWRATSRPLRVYDARVVVPPVLEPLTLDELKRAARITTSDEDVLLDELIRAAREKVERDTERKLLTQTVTFTTDRMPGACEVLRLPFPPLQAVESITATSLAGVTSAVVADQYLIDGQSLLLAYGGAWPTDLRGSQPFTVRLRVGWESPEDIPPTLVQAVRLLAVHYATIGRDIYAASTLITPVGLTYDECISPFRQIEMA